MIIARRNLVRLSVSSSIKISKFCTRIDDADFKLQNEYTGFLPRLQSLSTLFNEKGMQNFNNLFKEKLISSENFLNAVAVYADLQNPLLAKYKFDAIEFATGAKFAYLAVHSAINSADFANYCNKFANESTSQEMLSTVLHPHIYKACLEATTDLHKQGISSRLIENNLNSVILTKITTHIVADPQSLEESLFDSLFDTTPGTATATATAATTNVASPAISTADATQGSADAATVSNKSTCSSTETTTPATATAADTKDNNNDGVSEAAADPKKKKLLLGSVLATVDVLFNAHEKYECKLADGQEAATERLSSTTWTFQSCISGHLDMDWKIIAFDGRPARASIEEF